MHYVRATAAAELPHDWLISALLACSHLYSHLSHHEFLCISADFEELCNGIYKALVVEIAHLLNLTVMVSYPGIQLLHEALVGIGLVIVNRPDTDKQGTEERGQGRKGTTVTLKGICLSVT